MRTHRRHFHRRGQAFSAKRPALLARLGRLFAAGLLLLCAGALGFLFLLRGYVAATPEGPVLHAPLLVREESLSVFRSGKLSLEETESAAPEPLRAVLLPVETALEGGAEAGLRAVGGNAVVLDMKAGDGSLHYVSALPEAIDARLSESDPGRNEALLEFNRQKGRYSIARLSCFRDGGAAAAYPGLALRRVSGSLWRDETGTAWLSPAETAAQDYLLAVCRELAALGFDELLLTDCHFPKDGRQELLSAEAPRDAAGRTELLDAFYGRLQELAAETGCNISLLWAEEAEGDEGLRLSGQSLEAAVRTASRLWLPEGADFAPVSGRSTLSEAALVTLVTDATNLTGAWGILESSSGGNLPRNHGE